MPERMVSPGVFTRENDQSFLIAGVSQIGAAFVGPTTKGPAFHPVIISSPADFQRVFGDPSSDYYTPMAVKNYLKDAAQATIVRVLGLDGYDPNLAKGLRLSINGTGIPVTVGYIHPSQTGVTLPTGSISGIPDNFTLVISGASGISTFTSCSIDPTSANYFVKILGDDPKTQQDGFVYTAFPAAANYISGSLIGSGSIALSLASGELMLSGSTFGAYGNASTPYIRSQKLGGQYYDLFKVFNQNDGNSSNTEIKISIASIRPSPLAGEYGTFSLLVRDFNDTDQKTSILEQFDNLTMDPTSANYVAVRIGTQRVLFDSNGDFYLDGDFPNNSKYIYLAMADGADTITSDALPYGFDPLNTPLNRSDIPAPAYVTSRYTTPSGSSVSIADSRVYYGHNFLDATTVAYANALPSGSNTQFGLKTNGSVSTGFNLLEMLATQDTIDIQPTTATSLRKFTVMMQGGFDGQNFAQVKATGGNLVANNTQGFDLSDSTKSGAKAYVRAINILGNADVLDINLLITPGVVYSQHPYVVSTGITMCETRGDCFYVFDSDILGGTPANAINAVASIDSSYAATYHPWIKVLDDVSNKAMWVPPSVLIPGVYAFNDKVGAEWYAPAGLNRGGIGGALQVRSRLSKDDRNDLYEGRVNPIISFSAQGIVVWGQKTLQLQASALDRVNVRRLLIALKKFIASTSNYLVFEQNVDSTRARFLSIVNPYLANVQERNGLYAFRVIMDDTNNTPDLIDRNILAGAIYLKPTKTAEFIQLDFNILPTGATFPS